MKNLKRRQFIKKAIAGLAFVGVSLKSSFLKANEAITLEEQNLQKQFGTKSIRLDGTDNYIEVSEEDVRLPEDFVKGLKYNHWHHFVYNRVGNLEEVCIDGEIDEIMVLDDFSDCEIKNYRRVQVGILIEEEFWFRNKDNG